MLFFDDSGGVFDEMAFGTEAETVRALHCNGFSRWSERLEPREFVALPDAPHYQGSHPSGRIHSSGCFWKS